MRLFILCCWLLLASLCQAQQFSVTAFKTLHQDLTARSEHVVKDQNGYKAALIKLVTTIPLGDFSFDDGMLPPVKVSQKTAELWLYMPVGARFLTIQAKHQGVIRRYEFPTGALKEATTYEMKLNTAKVTTIVEEVVQSQWVTISSTPSGATVYLDGNNTGKQTPFQAEILLGNHTYKLAKDRFVTANGEFVLTANNKENLQQTLTPNFAKVTITDNTNTANSKFYIDGIAQTKTLPQTIEINSGQHIIKVENPQFNAQKKVITVEANTPQELNFNLLGKYGKLKVVSTPFNAAITLNGKHMGTTPNSFNKLLVGSYNLELKLQGHTSVKKQITITEEQTITLNETLAKGIVDKELPELVFVQGGTFTMGDTFGGGEDDEKPTHKVTLNDFYMSQTEVTVKQYRAYCKAIGTSLPLAPDFGWQDNHPMVYVSWNDAVDYCKWLSLKLNRNITLPTEAQWEYAARGGNRSKGYKYAGSINISDVAWYEDNSGNKTHPVGKKQPNELGLYDMSGNAEEWCQDWYDQGYYNNSSSQNPKGPGSGDWGRVIRGGSWTFSADHCRVSNRSRKGTPGGNSFTGFRVVAN